MDFVANIIPVIAPTLAPTRYANLASTAAPLIPIAARGLKRAAEAAPYGVIQTFKRARATFASRASAPQSAAAYQLATQPRAPLAIVASRAISKSRARFGQRTTYNMVHRRFRRTYRRRRRTSFKRTPRNMSGNTVTVRSVARKNISTSSGDMYWKVSLRNPAAASANNTVTMSGATINWSQFANMYDRYKINWVKIQFIPFNPDNSEDDGNAPMAIFLHQDAATNSSVPDDVPACMIRPGATLKNSNKAWTFFTRPPYLSASGSDAVGKGFYNTSNVVDIGQIMGRQANTGSATNAKGSLIITYSITFAALTQT